MLFVPPRRRRVGRGPGGAAVRPSSSAPLERWTAWVLSHRRSVLVIWLAALLGGVWAANALPDRLVNSFSVPGTESAQAQAVLARGFGERPEGTFTVVFRVRHSSDRAQQTRLKARLERAARVLPGGHLGVFRVGPGVYYGEIETALDLQGAKDQTGTLRRALRGEPAALVSGQPAIQHDLDPVLASDLRRGEAFVLPLAVLILAFALGLSAALLVPLLFALASIGATLVLLYFAARTLAVTPYAVNLVELVGLGLAVDYSLLIVCRYREELEAGGTREAAAERTIATAGRTVVFSGLAVAVGLALLLLVPVPFIRTLGLAGLLVPLVSVIAAVTLQPALLSLCGPRALAGVRLPGSRLRGHRPWESLARAIMRRPLVVLVPTAVVLLVAALPARELALGLGSLTSLPRQTEAAEGLFVQRQAFGPGALTPIEIVVDSGRSDGARSAEVRAAITRLSDSLFQDPEVFVVASGRDLPYTSSDRRYARVFVVGRHDYNASDSMRLVTRLRERLVPAARFPDAVRVAVGGAPAQGSDFLARSYEMLPWLVLAGILLTSLVLARAFRSVLLPLKALLLNLLSLGAAYGLLVAVFQDGIGASLLGVQRTQQIDAWVPLFLLAMLFGLSMDYEVFLVTRMREAWDERHDNVDAVTAGLVRTGRLITVAAFVMAVSFAAFVVGSVPGLQQFGLGLALAIVIDATLIRALLVPALMALLGRWNWWVPNPWPANCRSVEPASNRP